MNETMNHRAVPFTVAAVLCAVQFVLGLVVSPYSCGWGLPVFIAIGFITTLMLLSTPYFNRRAFNRNSRLSFGLMFAGVGVITWVLTMIFAFGRGSCGT